MIEIRAAKGFLFNAGIMRDPNLFKDRREQAVKAADIVDRIRQDEASHVGYLQLFISELRGFTFKTGDAMVSGSDFIDPLWETIVEWGSVTMPKVQRAAAKEQHQAFIRQHPDSEVILKEFIALADA